MKSWLGYFGSLAVLAAGAVGMSNSAWTGMSGAAMWRVALLSVLVGLASCAAGEEETPVAKHAVIVRFDYGRSDWKPFFDWEEEFEAAVTAAGVGEYDGNELAVDGSDGMLFLYGPDADKLFAVVKPHLEAAGLLKNIVVTLRYGAVDDAAAKETTVRVGS